MTLEEKVGQMMMVGFYGNQPTNEVERLIKEGNAGYGNFVRLFGQCTNPTANSTAE